MNRAPLAYLTAYLQSAVAILFMVGYFAMMAMLFFGYAKIPDNLLELAKTLAIALTNAMGLLFAFLYLRSRVDGPPDPSTTTTVQRTETTTLPSAQKEPPHDPSTLETITQPDPAVEPDSVRSPGDRATEGHT